MELAVTPYLPRSFATTFVNPAIPDFAGEACETRFRGESDYAAATLLAKQRRGVPDDVESSLQVHIYNGVPLFFGHVVNHPVTKYSCRGHDDIEAAK